MSYETHLFLRGRVFYLRLTRPAELQLLRRHERGFPLKRATIRRFVESAGDLSVHAYTAEHVAIFKWALEPVPYLHVARVVHPQAPASGSWRGYTSIAYWH